MLEGECPNCGYHCYGWVLTEPKQQICPNCGCPLMITRDRQPLSNFAENAPKRENPIEDKPH